MACGPEVSFPICEMGRTMLPDGGRAYCASSKAPGCREPSATGTAEAEVGAGRLPERGRKRPTRFPVVPEEPVCPAALTSSQVRGPGGRQVPVVLSQHTGRSRQLSSPQPLVTLAPPVPAYDPAFGTRAVRCGGAHTACAGPALAPLAPRRSTALPGRRARFTQILLVKSCFPSPRDCKADGTMSSPGCWPGAAAAF